MLKRLLISTVLLTLLFGVGLPVAQTRVQAQDALMIYVPEASGDLDLVAALAAGYAAQNNDFAYKIVPYTDESGADIAAADVLFSSDFASEPPIDFECGVISMPYVVLPNLGARYLASEDCGDFVAPDTPVKKDFLTFAVSADGQQIAIDLGWLPDSITVTDQAGVSVTVPQPVRGVVSAYGVSTYYVYSVGAGDTLLAGSYIGVRGPAAQDAMRRIDPNFDTVFNAMSAVNQNEINIEELAELGPDLVLASARTQWVDTVSELGIPILRFEGESPELLKESMLLIGNVLGPNAAYRAQLFNAYYDAQLAVIEAQVAEVDETPRVYFSGTEPLRTASGDMYQTAMIELAGGVSVSAELTGFWNDVNLEQVLVWEPDVIFVPTYGGATVEAFTESEEWGIIPAVEAGRVYQLPSFISPWDTPLPDSILGIMWMAETLYPEQIDLDCPAQTEYFYNTFYDYAISADEIQRLCE